jgi:hypothetical protein
MRSNNIKAIFSASAAQLEYIIFHLFDHTKTSVINTSFLKSPDQGLPFNVILPKRIFSFAKQSSTLK